MPQWAVCIVKSSRKFAFTIVVQKLPEIMPTGMGRSFLVQELSFVNPILYYFEHKFEHKISTNPIKVERLVKKMVQK